MHIVVMGCGRVGSALALQLEAHGHTVAVIDQQPTAFLRLGDEFQGITVPGVGFDQDTLIEAGIERADAFAAVSNGDNSNIIAARVARETFNVETVVARIYDAKRAEIFERLGIPTIATVPWTTNRLVRQIIGETIEESWRDPSGAVAAIRIQPHEGWVGHSVQEFERAVNGRIAMINRFGKGEVPLATTLLQDGDAVFVFIDDHYREAMGDVVHNPSGGVMKVAIVGAGSVGRSIARELISNGHEVMLIDNEQRKINPDRIPEATWVLGDAAEVSNLEHARLSERDVVVSATGDDKVNLVVSLLAKTEFSVSRVVARINHPSNEWLFTEAWGVDVAVSTPRVLAALVEEAVSVGDLVRLFSFRQGQANLIEITLPADSACNGRPVRDLNLPRDAALVTIVRGSRVITPTPDEPLSGGDELLFVATPEVENDVRNAICG